MIIKINDQFVIEFPSPPPILMPTFYTFLDFFIAKFLVVSTFGVVNQWFSQNICEMLQSVSKGIFWIDK